MSESFDPWFNLAVEEYLTANIKKNQVILYLWQNNNTVVIGSNQNAWKECDVGKIRNNNINLARRQSGGGAVFHDKGNLNFTFIAENSLFDIEKQSTVILEAVNGFGLEAEYSGRNDVLINNAKFSGNAFFSGDHASYHHGTLLIDADLTKLSEILTPSKQKINSKGIDSVRTRVINLNQLSQEITVKSMKERLIESFSNNYGRIISETNIDEDSYESAEFKKMYKLYSSWNWIYGDCPTFEAVHGQKFKWGEIEVGLNLKNGRITNTKVYSDSLVTTFSDKIPPALTGVKYESESILKAINSIEFSSNEKEIFTDIKALFNQQCI